MTLQPALLWIFIGLSIAVSFVWFFQILSRRIRKLTENASRIMSREHERLQAEIRKNAKCVKEALKQQSLDVRTADHPVGGRIGRALQGRDWQSEVEAHIRETEGLVRQHDAWVREMAVHEL